MLFSTFVFACFLALVVLVRWTVPKRALVPCLLVASWAFYFSFYPAHLTLLVGSCAFSYAMGLSIERATDRRKRLLVLALTGSLGLLGYFKYAAFAVAQMNAVREAFGAAPLPLPEIVLPLGISFSTFQMVSYVIDVYRGKPAEPSFPRFALYIAFFPHLIAGPIVRHDELIPQFAEPTGFDAMQAVDGLDLLALGYVKKLAFADNFGRFADTVFAHPERFDTLATWAGVLAYAGQIYCDFSAYTDIARGAAKLLGFELPLNFDLPYASRSITEFWRRWHITLSTWLRDYLYVSLGGNRHGKARQYRNLLVTMGLGGLWHGASWNFVFWGLFHGVLLLLHKVVDAAWSRVPAAARVVRGSFAYGFAAFVVTLTAVCVGWVFFRAPDLATAEAVLGGLFGARHDLPPVAPSDAMKTAVVLLVALAVGHVVRLVPWAGRAYARAPLPLRGVVWALAAAAAYLLATAGRTFIYFQF